MTTPAPSTSPDRRTVAILRLAMLIGAALFGVVIATVGGADPSAYPATTARTFTLIGRGVWGAALAGCLFLWAKARDERHPAKLFSLSMIGWALGEAVALFGGVYWYVLGSSQWYFPGLGFLALSMAMLPGVRRA